MMPSIGREFVGCSYGPRGEGLDDRFSSDFDGVVGSIKRNGQEPALTRPQCVPNPYPETSWSLTYSVRTLTGQPSVSISVQSPRSGSRQKFVPAHTPPSPLGG